MSGKKKWPASDECWAALASAYRAKKEFWERLRNGVVKMRVSRKSMASDYKGCEIVKVRVTVLRRKVRKAKR